METEIEAVHKFNSSYVELSKIKQFLNFLGKQTVWNSKLILALKFIDALVYTQFVSKITLLAHVSPGEHS